MSAKPAVAPAPPELPAAGSAPTMLSYFPVGMFGGVMGLIGLSAAWRLAARHFGAPLWISETVGALALLAFVAVAAAYAVKAWAGPAAVAAEFNHPVAGNLFGTPLVSLLLMPLILAEWSLPMARAAWLAGAVGMLLLAWWIVMRWMTLRHDRLHVTPAWIVPVVGLLDLPLAVPQLQWQGLQGLMIFSMAVGLFFALPLFTMISIAWCWRKRWRRRCSHLC